MSEPAPFSDPLDIGDIPMPEMPEARDVEDAFNYRTAFKFAFAGVGQGGSRLCEAFYDLGYRRVCAINTTEKDLEHIKIPASSKLVVRSDDQTGGDGAGKNPEVAKRAISGHTEEVYDLLRRSWGEKYDWSFICLGVGGGTGAGAFASVAEVAQKVMVGLKLEKRVGAVVALPKNDEGSKVARNAIATIELLNTLGLSPVIVIDNERIKQIYPRTPVGQFWSVANKSVTSLLHLFNRISAQSSKYSTFDPADFATILQSGLVAFGATKLAKYDSQADFSAAIRKQLQDNILASVDLSLGKSAGCIVVGNDDLLNSIPQEFLDHGFDMLTRVLSPGSMVHRGIYGAPTAKDLAIYTMIGGLTYPEKRLEELKKIGM